MSEFENEELSRVFDGEKCTYTPMMAKESREIFIQLVNKLGPVLGSGLKQLKGIESLEISEADHIEKHIPAFAETFGDMVIKLSDQITPAFYQQLTNTFLGRVRCVMETNEGPKLIKLKADIREVKFSRKLMLEMRILIWCLNLEYSDFFVSWKRAIAESLVKMTQKTDKLRSDCPQRSTGTSTESQQVTDITTP